MLLKLIILSVGQSIHSWRLSIDLQVPIKPSSYKPNLILLMNKIQKQLKENPQAVKVDKTIKEIKMVKMEQVFNPYKNFLGQEHPKRF